MYMGSRARAVGSVFESIISHIILVAIADPIQGLEVRVRRTTAAAGDSFIQQYLC